MNHIRSLTEDIWEGDSVDKDQYEQRDEEMEVEIRRPGKFFKNQVGDVGGFLNSNFVSLSSRYNKLFVRASINKKINF